jgi:3-oxoacyl-[acyl-carrier protein] reductase
MLLENKNAVIYGAGGSIGGAVARAFAREGARVFLAGRILESLEEVAEEIRSAGGVAETAQVDAFEEQAVDQHADAVAEKAGGIDVSSNLISYGDVQGTPLAEMPLGDFERPVATAVRTQFLTSRAAARHMIGQGSGVILFYRRLRGPVGRLLPGRIPSRAQRHRVSAPPISLRARIAWNPRRDPADGRGARDDPGELRWARGHHRNDR